MSSHDQGQAHPDTIQRRHVERFVRDHETWIQGLQSHGDPNARLTAVFAGTGT